MNVRSFHPDDKIISTKKIFQGSQGSITSLKLMANGVIKEHISKTPAFLICIEGEATYHDRNELHQTLHPGDFIMIQPLVQHWLTAEQDSSLLLVR